MYKLCFFVPENHAEPVKQAVFDAGGGRIGDYDSCAWQTRGDGQFRALDGADPYIGRVGEIERVSELKVELVCTDASIHRVIAALKKAHPYEEPAYDVFRLESF
ncbi:MAG: NGG1p interacting factor NIF3 [Pseudomonadota bacterium]